jgi:hypothetical protein
MILKIKKKFAYIVFFLLVFLSVFLSYTYLGITLPYGVSSPFDEIMTSCLKSGKGMEDKDVSCIAFLDDIKYLDNSEKFSISVLTSDFILNTYEIEQDNNLVKLDERLFTNSGKSYPIYLDFDFGKKNFFKKNLNSIDMSLIEGQEYEDVVQILRENGIDIIGVYNKETETILNRGYNIGQDIYISEGKYLKSVNIFSGNIYDISYANDEFTLDLKVVLYGEEYDTQFKLNKIILASFTGNEEIVVIDDTDLHDYKKDILGSVSFVSIFDGISSKLSVDEINNYCKEIDDSESSVVFCDYLDNIEVSAISEDDIIDYFDIEISKESNNAIDLSKLLPINFIEMDDEI